MPNSGDHQAVAPALGADCHLGDGDQAVAAGLHLAAGDLDRMLRIGVASGVIPGQALNESAHALTAPPQCFLRFRQTARPRLRYRIRIQGNRERVGQKTSPILDPLSPMVEGLSGVTISATMKGPENSLVSWVSLCFAEWRNVRDAASPAKPLRDGPLRE